MALGNAAQETVNLGSCHTVFLREIYESLFFHCVRDIEFDLEEDRERCLHG